MTNPFIEIFAPYLPFITFLLTITLNIWFLTRGWDWIKLLIANIIIIILFQAIGIGEYNFITVIVRYLTDIITEVIEQVFISVDQFLDEFFEGLKPDWWPW